MTESIVLSAGTQAWKGNGKPYVARLTGLNSRTNFEREFLPKNAHVTETGVYETRDFDKKDRPDTNQLLVIRFGDGLRKFYIRTETAVEILKSGRRVDELDVWENAEKELCIRANGKDGPLKWKVKSSPEMQQLQDEKKRLESRIAEIDAALGQSV